MIDPGKLNRRLTIRRRTLVGSGQWGDEYEWQDLRTIWAAVRYDSVDEGFAADEHYAVRVVTFTIRFTHDLSEVDRVVCEGVEYEILGVTEIGHRDGLELKGQVFDPGAEA